MVLEMVLNDLSLRPQAKDIYAAQQRMNDFIELLKAVASFKVERVLRTEYSITAIELAVDYPVSRWLNDSEVDREIRRYLRSLATQVPYLRDDDGSHVSDAYYASEFFYGQERAIGLGMAFLLDALAVSFHSHSAWETSSLELSLQQLQEDQLIEQAVWLKHACKKEHILEHRAWIRNRVQVDVESGVDLCVHCKALYPHLQFCQSALAQIQAILRGDPLLRQIMRHLLYLNDYCESWESGPFTPKDTIAGKISEESQATLKKYAQEHTFQAPDSSFLLFSWHARVTPGKGRIYFYPLEQEREIIIGYIGPKLPNVTYPS